MSKRTGAVILVLGLGFTGIALAQQVVGLPRAAGQATEKAKLRAQVVKLRVEIDLMQLEHDAERDSILTLIKGGQQTAQMGSGLGGVMGTMMLETQAMMGDTAAIKALEEAMEAKDDKERERLVAAASKKQAEGLRANIDRKKKDYAAQSTKLAEKHLDLEELETQHRTAR